MKSGVLAIAVAAIATGVSAGKSHLARRHAHDAFHHEMPRELVTVTSLPPGETCGSTTVWVTVTGEGTRTLKTPIGVLVMNDIDHRLIYGLPPPPPPPAALSNTSVSVPITSSAPSSSASKLIISLSSNSSSAVPTTSSTPSSTVILVSSTSTIANVPTPLATTCPTPGIYTIPATTVTLTSSTTVCAPASATVTPGTNTIGGVVTVVTTATTVVCPYATVSTNSGVVTSTILTTTYVCPSAGTYTIAPITTSVSAATTCVFPTPASYAPGTYTQPLIVTTITATDVVVFCPFASSTAAPSTSSVALPVTTSSVAIPVTTSSVAIPVTSSSVVAPPATTSSVLVALPATTSSVFFSLPVSSTSQAQSSAAASSSAPKSSSSGSSVSIGSSGDQWAMTYTPYSSSGGGCLSEAQVAIDIMAIKTAGFKSVRLYSTDCSTLDFVGKAAKLAGLKLILGVFIDKTGISAAQEQVSDIVAWAQWDLVELIVIGNEAIFNKYCTVQELADFISSCKTKFSGAGYTGQCTTTEPLNVWQESGVTDLLCPLVDVTGANIHPFFNADVSPDQAGSFTLAQLQIADNLCSGKSAINLECGWPSSGQCNGLACPGEDHQVTAINAITKAVGGKTALFSFTNDMWKAPGDLDCEQFWGSIHLFADVSL
ncbi:putative beta-glucosidase [Lachnellula subtilissima]|uniref:Probable beta-glucosidase btgE n=1 Tax=Lachnellula subtilissima TaxID=602034 RepID=A0A8H8RWX2_9HELO|nr:putative beta-glucosidase [Lachnellula subtilissima]